MTFWGLLYRPPFTDDGRIWWATADPSSTLTGQISSECVHCVGFRWPKNNFGQILTFWGHLYRPPFTDKGQISCAIADPRYTLTCQISSRSVYSIALCRRKAHFLPFFGLRHLVLSPIGNSLRKLNTDAQLQTFPYPTASVLQRLHGEMGAVSDVQKRDEQTSRQTDRQTDKKLNIFGHPRGG